MCTNFVRVIRFERVTTDALVQGKLVVIEKCDSANIAFNSWPWIRRATLPADWRKKNSGRDDTLFDSGIRPGPVSFESKDFFSRGQRRLGFDPAHGFRADVRKTVDAADPRPDHVART